MGEVMGQEDCNRTSFCDGSARSARVKQNAAEQLENTVGRSDALVFLDSLDSLPEWYDWLWSWSGTSKLPRPLGLRDFCDGLTLDEGAPWRHTTARDSYEV